MPINQRSILGIAICPTNAMIRQARITKRHKIVPKDHVGHEKKGGLGGTVTGVIL